MSFNQSGFFSSSFKSSSSDKSAFIVLRASACLRSHCKYTIWKYSFWRKIQIQKSILLSSMDSLLPKEFYLPHILNREKYLIMSDMKNFQVSPNISVLCKVIALLKHFCLLVCFGTSKMTLCVHSIKLKRADCKLLCKKTELKVP